MHGILRWGTGTLRACPTELARRAMATDRQKISDVRIWHMPCGPQSLKGEDRGRDSAEAHSALFVVWAVLENTSLFEALHLGVPKNLEWPSNAGTSSTLLLVSERRSNVTHPTPVAQVPCRHLRHRTRLH